MRIAVIENSAPGDYAEYISSLLNDIAKENYYQLKSWSNSVPAFQQQVNENAIIHIYVDSTSSFFLNLFYRRKLISILKKAKIEVVIDLNGMSPVKLKIPWIIAIDQFFLKNQKQLYGAEKFFCKNLSQSLKNATNILSYSKNKLDVLDEKNKRQHIPFTAPPVFKTFEWHEKIIIKAQQADNKEYFASVIEDNAVDDFVLLLQAFSKFKKWQNSSMQLLVLPKYESLGEDIREKHKTYKYRDDVRLIEDIEERQLAEIIASAHSLIHVFSNIPHLFVIAIALQCSLPIISFADDDVKEYAEDAVIICGEKNTESLGNAIIQLYKDEKKHEQMKEAAYKQSLFLNRKECGERLWRFIETAAHS